MNTLTANSAATLASAAIDAYNQHDLAHYRSLHSRDSEVEFAGVAGSVGLDDWLGSLHRIFAAIPDLRIAPVTLVTDERSAVVEMIQTGTHTGALTLHDGERKLLGTTASSIRPTGRRIAVSGVVVLTTDGQFVTAQRHHWPRWWLYEELGLVTVTATPVIV
jgi:predicted ester cyclase